MPLTETLTVQILGDSSDLQQELTQVADLLAGLQQQLADAAGATGEFGNAFQGLSSALRPLQGISNQLAAISQQIQALAQQPVTLSVAPALEALQQLLQAAQATAQQLAALNLSIGLGGLLPTGGGEGPVRGYATGGLVSGPTGIDQVSARLTAGEYILNSQAVATIGVTQLDRLNDGRTSALRIPNPTWQSATASTARPTFASAVPTHSTRQSNNSVLQREFSGLVGQQTTNHFGGIEINVRETANVDQLLHDLRRQGIGQQHRRG
ncbi:hypothetical protein [Planctomicrobium piriforme]|uniref:Uncharacterized protein n=1 Tax=Planctomicrobium piriforme TaxID=1576369 RepID=A0A1I3C1F0_9PLAN|nr:hypothetical protein [Planctomicrobium piriforme]SFH68448.1 hypothetical protein SAMN05421753_10247 [Planctomicrobium piriforme]